MVRSVKNGGGDVTMKKENRGIPAVIIALAIVAVAIGVLATVIILKKIDDSNYVYPEKVEEQIKKAPDFTATLLTGEEFTLSENIGKPVLVNFWATWCGPCVGEMPAFEQLKKDYGDEVVIVAVNCGEKAETVQEFVDENGYTFNFALDEKAKISTNIYPTMSIPYTVLIDADGNIAEEFVGAVSAEKQYKIYKEAIEKVLNEKE